MTASTQSPPHVTQVTIRALRPEDWEAARCVWLAALADCPGAFQQTLDEAVAMPDELWRQRALESAVGQKQCGFLAFRRDVPCGMVLAERTSADSALLHSLWVAQNARRSGVGRALVQAVCAWAAGRGAAQVYLDVVEGSAAAIALYRANGFVLVDGVRTTCGARKAPAARMSKRLTS